MVAVLASAGDKLGIANSQSISVSGNVRIGDVLLPQGDYSVKHEMDGENHSMVFSRVSSGKPTSFRVKCSLVPLAEKSKTTEKTYTVNAAKGAGPAADRLPGRFGKARLLRPRVL